MVRSQLEDAEYFLRKFSPGDLIVLDEVHRLLNPSEFLKIAADHFPKIKVVATGSSTLGAKSKFRDTLTGRKRELWLLPSISHEWPYFGVHSIDQRMIKGGLPPFLLAPQVEDGDYNEWIESFWAKDVQELFVVEKRASFMKFIELLMRQSGELFEAQSFTSVCEISRQTVQNYLGILETTLLVVVLRPFSSGSAVEIKSQPKVYGFDTGFVCFFKAISDLRDEDRGMLLEHLVLNELLAHVPRQDIFYWRDKQKHEIDFVIKRGRSNQIDVVECKARRNKFSAGNLKIFRAKYPRGRNIVVSLDQTTPETGRLADLDVDFCDIHHLRHLFLGEAKRES